MLSLPLPLPLPKAVVVFSSLSHLLFTIKPPPSHQNDQRPTGDGAADAPTLVARRAWPSGSLGRASERARASMTTANESAQTTPVAALAKGESQKVLLLLLLFWTRRLSTMVVVWPITVAAKVPQSAVVAAAAAD